MSQYVLLLGNACHYCHRSEAYTYPIISGDCVKGCHRRQYRSPAKRKQREGDLAPYTTYRLICILIAWLYTMYFKLLSDIIESETHQVYRSLLRK